MANEFNIQEAEVLMLEIVSKRINQVFEEAAILWNMLQKGESQFTNSRGVRLVTYVEPNPGQTWYSEGAVLAAPNTSVQIDMRVFFTRFVITGGLTGDVIDLTEQEALAKALNHRMIQDTKSGLKEFNQACYEAGTGRKALVTAASGTGATFGYTDGSGGSGSPYGARRLLRRASYEFYDEATGTRRQLAGGATAATLSSKSNGTGVTVWGTNLTTGADPVIAGDIAVLQGSYNKVLHGLPYHINDDNGFYQGQSRATYGVLKAPVIDAVHTFLSVSLMDKMIYQTLYRTGADVETSDFMIISSMTQHHRYNSLGYNLRRYSSGETFDGTGKDVKHQGLSWKMDTDCGDKDIYFLRTSAWGRYELHPFELLKKDGNVLRMAPATDTSGNGSFADKYIYHMVYKGDLGCTHPEWNARIKNLGTTDYATGLFG